MAKKELKGGKKHKLLAERFIDGVERVDRIYFDPGQPRQRFFLDKVERIAASTGKGFLFNRPVIERMGQKRFKEYLQSLEPNRLQKRYLAEIEKAPRREYSLLVFGATRELSVMMNDYKKIPVKYSPPLTKEQRRDLQIHEDSQLAPHPWNEAKTNVKIFEEMNKERERLGEKPMNYVEFSKYQGIGDDRFKMQRDYVYELSSAVKKLVEKYRTLDFSAAALIAKYEKDPEKQLIYASKGRSRKDLEDLIISKKNAESKTPCESEESVLVVQDMKRGASKRKFDLRQMMNLVQHSVLKTARLSQLNHKNIFAENGLAQKTKNLEGIVVSFKARIDPQEYDAARKRVEKSRKMQRYSEDIVDILEKVDERRGKYRQTEILKVIEPKLINIKDIRITKNTRFGPDFTYNPKDEQKLIDELGIESLADSIAEEGLLNPILLERNKNEYSLTAGFRRYLAHKVLYRRERDKKWKKIPAIFTESLSELQRLEYMAEENTQVSFSPEERAKAWYDSYMMKKEKNSDLTLKQFSKMIGKPYGMVKDAIKYMAVSPREVRSFVDEELFTHSKAIIMAENAERNGQILLTDEDQVLIAEEDMLVNYNENEFRGRVKAYIDEKAVEDPGQLSFGLDTKVNKYYPLVKQLENYLDLFESMANNSLEKIASEDPTNKNGINHLASAVYQMEKTMSLAKKYLK